MPASFHRRRRKRTRNNEQDSSNSKRSLSLELSSRSVLATKQQHGGIIFQEYNPTTTSTTTTKPTQPSTQQVKYKSIQEAKKRQVSSFKPKSYAIWNTDDTDLAFVTRTTNNDNDIPSSTIHTKTRQKINPTCIPWLLYERQVYGLNNDNKRKIHQQQQQPNWKSKMTMIQVRSKTSNRYCRRWKPAMLRSIPFTKLHTPMSDAVLALERHGSFVLSLGMSCPKNLVDQYSNNDDSYPHETPLSQQLALRFYGIPSPSIVNSSRMISSSILGSVPIPIPFPRQHQRQQQFIFPSDNLQQCISPATTTPIQILISSDWNIGVAYVHHTLSSSSSSSQWNDEHSSQTGSMILFTIPRSNQSPQAFQCQNVPLVQPKSGQMTIRNRLWKVTMIPFANNESKASALDSANINNDIDSITWHYLPRAYMVVNDEHDGYRFTWIYNTSWDIASFNQTNINDVGFGLNNGHPLPDTVFTVQHTWKPINNVENHTNDNNNNNMISNRSGGGNQIMDISLEAFLNVELLLHTLLSSRKSLQGKTASDFYYNLISVSNGGILLDLVITCKLTQQPSTAIGVFVQVDLCSMQFQDTGWVKTEVCKSMAKWCSTLALNFRLRHVRAGPCSCLPLNNNNKNNNNHATASHNNKDWSKLCREMYFDLDEADDTNPTIWSLYYSQATSSAVAGRPPKLISFASIYPDCDYISNQAVTSNTPVWSLQCKSAPVRLVYG